MARLTMMSTGSSDVRREPLHHPLRFPAALLLAVAGAVHVPVIPQHLQEAPYIGALFIVLTALCLGLALVLPRYDTSTVWAASGVITAVAVLAYALSRTVGLPQIGDDIGNWTDPLGLAAIASEGLTAALAATALTQQRE
ncbi:hypothetical protein [Streptomyces sp. NPDC056670]|uniref:hypothetical protein n=1 Tax=Streptomyces sp. NPDC056670 TaxID=3345904 RepID=UPI003694F609